MFGSTYQTMKLITFFLLVNLVLLFFPIASFNKSLEQNLKFPIEKNISFFATGLSEILEAIGDNSIVILLPPRRKRIKKLDEFLKKAHTSLTIQTFLFTHQEKFYAYIATSLKRSVETTSLVFDAPDYVIQEVRERNLAHRLSVFLFYWGAKTIEDIELTKLELREPLRTAFITHPRKEVYRVYYNQAVSDGTGKMKMVNWYDAKSLGLFKEPLLPRLDLVFKKLVWRTLYVPAINVRIFLKFYVKILVYFFKRARRGCLLTIKAMIPTLTLLLRPI